MVEKKQKIRFTQTCVVKDHEGEVIDTFEAGKTYALQWASAQRWVRREVAEPVTTAAPKPKPAAQDADLEAG